MLRKLRLKQKWFSYQTIVCILIKPLQLYQTVHGGSLRKEAN